MIHQFFQDCVKIVKKLDKDRSSLHKLVNELHKIQRQGGRLFILGVGGGAANASHAAADFRKLCGVEAYGATDNVAELTARTNDEGWHTTFREWLKISKLTSTDAVFVFSVGGGDVKKNVSTNLVEALKFAHNRGAVILGIVGRDGGYTKKVANACVVVPTVNKYLVTPFVEGFQAIIWHMLVFHPDLQLEDGKWETIIKKQ